LAHTENLTSFTPKAKELIEQFFSSYVTMNIVRMPVDDDAPYGIECYNGRKHTLTAFLGDEITPNYVVRIFFYKFTNCD